MMLLGIHLMKSSSANKSSALVRKSRTAGSAGNGTIGASPRRVIRRSLSAPSSTAASSMYHEPQRERPPFRAASRDSRKTLLFLGFDVRIGRHGFLELLDALACLVLIVVQVLERKLLRGKRRHRLVLVGPEQARERAGFRHPVELLAT